MSKRLAASETFVSDFDARCPCGNHATHLLTLHSMDDCVEGAEKTGFVCNACLAKAYEYAAELERQEAVCLTCGLHIDMQCAIIVSLIPLRRGKDGP